ncbi:MAG: LacI family DNA-binding transcriptional regulator [Blautia sp.]
MAEKKKNITFNDIAKFTGFSKTTISRYFNNPDSLTPENQKIVSDALEKLDYKENKVARILANGQTEFIGILIPNLYLAYYSEMLNQILATYETFGYKFLVFIGNNKEETERKYIQELMAYKIEGLIVLSHTLPSLELASLQIPVVAVEREDHYISSVNCDNYSGSLQACRLLASHNCQIFIHINTPTDKQVPAYKRMEAFQDYCREHAKKHEIFVHHLGNTYEEIKENLEKILDSIHAQYKGCRTGIFVSGDTYANIFLNLVVRKYGHLPDDWFLIGFDDSPVSREAIFPISSVSQQIEKLAYEAVKLLVEQICEHKKRKAVPLSEPVHKMISPVVIPRETTEKKHSGI